MRDELELMEKIELYLTNQLSREEATAFEQQMLSDEELRNGVALQRDIMRGIQRTSLSQQVKAAANKYHSGKAHLRWGLGGGIVAIIIIVSLFLLRSRDHVDLKAISQNAYIGTMLPTLNEAGTADWASADSMIPAETFIIDPSKDTVIETLKGIVLAIPANAFLDGAGTIVEGPIGLYIKEAIDPLTIMMAGLSTWSDGRLLETGGMFFIDARQGDGILKIDPENGIYAEIPGSAKAGMQLFSGKRIPGGGINWVDPKPLSHELLAVDIASLDFYPPDYHGLLHQHEYVTSDKRFTDSVYYSLAELFDTSVDKMEGQRLTVKQEILAVMDSAFRADTTNTVLLPAGCGINPAKIKTIWSNKYQNTLLATREFEQRINLIHTSRNHALLDLYVANLDKNLYEIDSMAASIAKGSIRKEFLQFAAQRDGKLRSGSKQLEGLRNYYAEKTRLLTTAIATTQNKIRLREEAADVSAQQKRTAYNQQAEAGMRRVFEEELSVNLKSASRQLGRDLSTASAVQASANPYTQAPASRYAVVVTNTGWSNVDKYVQESTVNRTTIDYTDPQSGKKAVIEYKPILINIDNAGNYDRLMVYLIPARLSSFMKLDGSGGTYMERLNGLMQYDLVCLGIKGTQQYYLRIRDVTPKRYERLYLKPLDARTLEAEIAQLKAAGQAVPIRAEINYAIWDLANTKAAQTRARWQAMIGDLEKSFFPCVERKGLDTSGNDRGYYVEPVRADIWRPFLRPDSNGRQ